MTSTDSGVIRDQAIGLITQPIRSNIRDGNGMWLNLSGGDYTRYLANPVMLLEHSSTVLGRCEKLFIRPNEIVAQLRYDISDLEALKYYQADKRGFLPSASVGIVPVEFETVPEGIDVQKWILVEISKVAIPADPYATQSEPETVIV